MDKHTYINADPGVQKALAKLNLLRATCGGRWGEVRRFAGASAGIRLDKIQQAEQSWSRAYDRAETRFNKQPAVAAQ